MQLDDMQRTTRRPAWSRQWPQADRALPVVEVGELARRALARSGGIASPLTELPTAPYFDAAGEIVWIGAKLPVLHPRAVVTTAAPHRGVALRLRPMPDRGWSAHLALLDVTAANRVRSAAQRLSRSVARSTAARGFGNLLTGRKPPFPLDLCALRVDNLIAAYALDDADRAVSASRALLGVGTGLTPSGDDLVGAALFGHRLVTGRSPGWDAAAAELSIRIKELSNAVSAALFSDLARGQSFAPLHALAEALVQDDDSAALRAACELSALGHSSGWDMLTGFIIGTNAGTG